MNCRGINLLKCLENMMGREWRKIGLLREHMYVEECVGRMTVWKIKMFECRQAKRMVYDRIEWQRVCKGTHLILYI